MRHYIGNPASIDFPAEGDLDVGRDCGLTPLAGGLGEYLDRSGSDGRTSRGRSRDATLGGDVSAEQVRPDHPMHRYLVSV
jgi:hypothetical protein